MATFRVTACWYESVYVEAEDEDEALDIAYRESFSGTNYVGTPDDYEIEEEDNPYEN